MFDQYNRNFHYIIQEHLTIRGEPIVIVNFEYNF